MGDHVLFLMVLLYHNYVYLSICKIEHIGNIQKLEFARSVVDPECVEIERCDADNARIIDKTSKRRAAPHRDGSCVIRYPSLP